MTDFPRYLITEEGESVFVPLREAGIKMDSMWTRVELGGLVLLEDFKVRKITKEENDQIQEIADEYSANK